MTKKKKMVILFCTKCLKVKGAFLMGYNNIRKTIAAIAAMTMLCSVGCGGSKSSSSNDNDKSTAGSSVSSATSSSSASDSTNTTAEAETEATTETHSEKSTEATTEMTTEEMEEIYSDDDVLEEKIMSFIVDIRDNGRTSITPQEFADKRWKDIKKLGIWGDDFCQINQADGFGYGLDKISNFRNLDRLSKELSSLEELTLAYGNLRTCIFPCFPNLKTLNIFECLYDADHVYEVLSEMENLTELYIEVDSELEEMGEDSLDINGISSVKSLTRLDLPSTGLTDISPLSSLVNLQHLNLNFNSISDITPLASLENLQFLDLMGNPISDITPLLSLKNLKTLYIGGLDYNISDEDMERLREALPDCEIN